MWILVSAIVTASLSGSMHCVGMCGPLAIWASRASDRISTNQMTLATTLYHLGRLLTYALAGMLAGAGFGQLVDMGGQALGVQLFATHIVGGLMTVFGLLQLLKLAGQWRVSQTRISSATPQPSLVTRWLLRAPAGVPSVGSCTRLSDWIIKRVSSLWLVISVCARGSGDG